jgi:1-acyl-sn-glycerol-3-phosphate acyltransferase
MKLRETIGCNWLDYGWRLFGTGLSFACFGVGGILVSLSLFPLIRLLSPDKDTTRRRVQRAMQAIFRVFVWQMTTLGVISYEVSGRERLAGRGQLIVANHPSLIDVVLLIALLPEVDCIVKQALWRNPFLRGPVAWADYIPNSGSAEELVASAAARLRAGRSLIVFPEGTRSVPGQPLRMQRGAARIALAAAAPVLPVTIDCNPLMLSKHQPWYRVPPRPGHWRLLVGEPLPAARFNGEPEALAARHLTEFLLEYFSRSANSLPQAVPAQAAPLTPNCTMP